jgi:hypothetical protein
LFSKIFKNQYTQKNFITHKKTSSQTKKLIFMRKLTSFIALLLAAKLSMAQGVAINNNNALPNSSAMLDVQSTTKGMLIPRMTTAQRTGIASPAKGLMVFDTDVNSFWFYNGSAWTNLTASGAATGLSLTGNSGTNTASNYLGTTDNVSLNIKTNNLARLTVADNGNIGINNTTPAAKLDVKSTSGNTNANFYLTGNSSTYLNGVYSVASNSGTGGAYGGNFTATGNSSGTVAAVSAYAQSGYKNYGFFGGVLTSGGQWGYGVYATATGTQYTTGGYFKGDGTGVEAIGGNWGVKGTGLYGGEFTGTGTGVVASGGKTGGRFSGTYKGIEVNLSTATQSYAFPQLGIDVEVTNTANTDQVFGVYSHVDGKNAISNVIGIYSEPYGPKSSFLTSFYGAGNVNISGNYYSSSDAKLKQNIKPIQSMMDKIMQLKPSSYQYRTEEYKMNLPKGNQFGLIAQDVQKVFPELVADQVKPASFDKKTNEKLSDEVKYLGVNYTGLIPIIISGMQDLKRENAELKKEIAELKNKK